MNDLLTIIKSLCEKKGISIRKLETELGFAHGTIGVWDKSRPSVDRASAVADYFGVSLDYLLGRNEMTDDEEINALFADPEFRVLFKRTAKMKEQDQEFVKRMIRSIQVDE